MSIKKKITIYGIAALLLFGVGFWVGRGDYGTKTTKNEKTRKKQETKIVERIVEKPGGERVIYRTIREKKDETSKKRVETVKNSKKWLVGLSRSVYGYKTPSATHTLSVYKKAAGSLYVGLWGTTDAEYGVGLIYSF